MNMTDPSRITDHPVSPYRGRRIVVGTRHGKERQFQPAFQKVLGAHLLTPDDLDTDQLGTFSGETPRTMSPVAAARAKAQLAMMLTGLPFGLASEASYGTLGQLGWAGHEEVLIFCDAELGTEVLVGYRTADVPGCEQRVRDPGDIAPELLRGLPSQALIVRPAQPLSTAAIIKGIVDVPTLRTAIIAAAAESADLHAIVEPDLRAHHNPSRQRVLARLADSLAHRLATPCPACRAPGFGRLDTEPGLPCRSCGTPTAIPISEIHGCPACDHREQHPINDAKADPLHCPRCNP